MIELGRIDIATEVSMLSSHMALPRQGHLETALHVMSYLGLHHNSRLCVDPTYPEIDHDQFPVCDWSEFYGEVEVPIPPDAPKPLRKAIDLRMLIAIMLEISRPEGLDRLLSLCEYCSR